MRLRTFWHACGPLQEKCGWGSLRLSYRVTHARAVQKQIFSKGVSAKAVTVKMEQKQAKGELSLSSRLLDVIKETML